MPIQVLCLVFNWIICFLLLSSWVLYTFWILTPYGDPSSIPGSARSTGEGKGCPLQYSGLENSMLYSPWGRKELDTTEWLSLPSLTIRYMVCKYFFLHSLFILLIASFVVQKLLSLILCLMFFLDFVAYTLGVIAEKSLPRSMLGSFCFLLGVSDFTFTFHFYTLEKEMATHSSVLAWRIPGMGSHRVGHDWSDLAAAGVLWFQDFCLDRQSIFS